MTVRQTRRRALGLCCQCPAVLPDGDDRVKCHVCRTKAARQHLRRRAKLRRQRLCVSCGWQPAPNYEQCLECRLRRSVRGHAARAAGL